MKMRNNTNSFLMCALLFFLHRNFAYFCSKTGVFVSTVLLFASILILLKFTTWNRARWREFTSKRRKKLWIYKVTLIALFHSTAFDSALEGFHPLRWILILSLCHRASPRIAFIVMEFFHFISLCRAEFLECKRHERGQTQKITTKTN